MAKVYNILLISTLLFFGCNREDPELQFADKSIEAEYVEPPAFSVKEVIESAGDVSPDIVEQLGLEELPHQNKLIKKGEIIFSSQDFEAEQNELKRILGGYNAYIEDESQTSTKDLLLGRINIRVAVQQYDSLFSQVQKISTNVISKHSNVEDISDYYFDLQTRLSNKRVMEKRYLELLSQTESMKDILMIEDHLSSIRMEIELMDGEQRSLNSRIAYSTLEVRFEKNVSFAISKIGQPDYSEQFKKSLSGGWKSFLQAILVITYVWPFTLFFVLFLILKRYFRKTKNKSQIV